MICKIFNINVRKIIYQYRLLKQREKKINSHICIKNKNRNNACYSKTRKYKK